MWKRRSEKSRFWWESVAWGSVVRWVWGKGAEMRLGVRARFWEGNVRLG